MKIETLPLTPVDALPRQKRWKLPLIGAIVVVLAGTAYVTLQPKAKPAAAATSADKGPPKVDTVELAGGDVYTIGTRELSLSLPLSGSLTPLAQATVKSKVSGVVLETTLQEGMRVAKGQVIARLDQADYQARYNQQKAALDEASAKLALAKKNNANSAALLKQNYISQNTYDTTQGALDQAQAVVASAEATLELARIALADTVIRAPLDGVVAKRHVQAGEKVAPDMAVYSIVNLNPLTLEAPVPAADIPRVHIGQDVQFRVDGFPARSFTGKVTRINPATEVGSRSMLVYINVPNDDSALRAGMFAKGQVTTEKTAAMPLVPLVALRKDKQQDVVYTIEDGKVASHPIKVGLRNEDEGFAEVLDGLPAGTRVISAKIESVKPGSKVRIADGTALAVKG